MNFTSINPLCLLILLASPLSFAFPVVGRDVYVPSILAPSEGDVWVVGENRTVEWNVISPPKHITNMIGKIQLRKGDTTLPIILAGDFDILSGSVVVTVPRVEPDNDYRVVLFGNSGNWSPSFSIFESISFKTA